MGTRTASPRGRYGERYTHFTMLRGMQANFAKRRALSQLYPATGVAPGTADGCQWYYPLRPKAQAAYPSTYLLGAGITRPRVELKVLESEKDSFKGIWPGTWLTRSWPITQGLPLALSKLTEGTVSTDLLVAYTPFFFWPNIYGTRERGPRHKPGL